MSAIDAVTSPSHPSAQALLKDDITRLIEDVIEH
jgi:hypothetical protein